MHRAHFGMKMFGRLLAGVRGLRWYNSEAHRRKRLIILGTGWAGYSLLKHINKKLFDVVVVSPRNHFLFTPLLASTTVGTLEFRSIIEPIRNHGFRDERHFHLSRAVGLDMQRRIISCQSQLDSTRQYNLSYDRLVIAVGALSNTFGVPGVEKHAFFLKVYKIYVRVVTANNSVESSAKKTKVIKKLHVLC